MLLLVHCFRMWQVLRIGIIHILFISRVWLEINTVTQRSFPLLQLRKYYFFYPNASVGDVVGDILRTPLLRSAWVLCSWIKASIHGIIHSSDLEKGLFAMSAWVLCSRIRFWSTLVVAFVISDSPFPLLLPRKFLTRSESSRNEILGWFKVELSDISLVQILYL